MAKSVAERKRDSRIGKDKLGLCRICGVKPRKNGISALTKRAYVNCGGCIDSRKSDAPPKPLLSRKMTIEEARIIYDALTESTDRDGSAVIKSAMNRNFS